MVMCTTTGNVRERFVRRPRQTGQTSMYDRYGLWRGAIHRTGGCTKKKDNIHQVCEVTYAKINTSDRELTPHHSSYGLPVDIYSCCSGREM